MKKFLLAALLVAGMLSMTACGGSGGSENQSNNSGGNSNQQASGADVTLELWHIHTAEARKNAIESAVKRFEQENNVKVNISIYENDPYKTKLKTVMGTGDEPDIFHSWGGGWLKSFVDAGLVYDMTSEVTAYGDKLNETVIEMNTFDGKIWGAPLFNSSTILYYNKEIFEQCGLQPPRTFDDLMAACETLKENGVYPFALGNKSKWPGAQHFVLLSMRLGGADIFQRAVDGETTFEDPAFIEAGKMLIDMVDKGYFPEGVNGINYDTGGSRMMFYTGQCAMILQTSGFLASAYSEDPDFYENKLGVLLYPEMADSTGRSTDILAGENAFSVSAASKNTEMSAKLVEFLSTDETLQQEFADNGTLTALKGIVPSDPLVKAAMDQLSEASYLQNFIDQTLDPELSEKHKDTVQALLGKTMTSEEAAAEMQQLYESIN